jgi:penicillin V acylase-like amidase (Ntn superfamily)
MIWWQRLIFWLLPLLSIIHNASACSNFFYQGAQGYWVARNFDWRSGHTALVINPIGVRRKTLQLQSGERVFRWVARYGSLSFKLTTPQGRILPIAVQGGMNQKGLVVSLQELESAQFPKPSRIQPNINNTYLVQYWLDTAKDVPMALRELRLLNVVTTWWSGQPVPIHYILHDAAGHTAVVEFLKGRVHVYRGSALPYRVVTNTLFSKACHMVRHLPVHPSNSYYSDARLLRGYLFLKRLPLITSEQQAIALGFAALQTVAEPLTSPWPTQWRVVYDIKRRVVYYQSLHDPYIYQVDLQHQRFKQEAWWMIAA